jgi:hypothetical protein
MAPWLGDVPPILCNEQGPSFIHVGSPALTLIGQGAGRIPTNADTNQNAEISDQMLKRRNVDSIQMLKPLGKC